MLVQDFLEQSAAVRPEHVALICGDLQFTYAQVEAMANRLANALIAAGVFMATAPQPLPAKPVEKVILGAPQYPTGAVTYANSLPGTNGASGAPAGGMGGGSGVSLNRPMAAGAQGAGGGSSRPMAAGASGGSSRPMAAGAQGGGGGRPMAAGAAGGGGAGTSAAN